MIRAGIDIGTNTALMVIADVASDGTIDVLHDVHTLPRLGEGLMVSGAISESSIQRAVESMQTFASHLEAAKPQRVRIVATSAMREALNGSDVQRLLESIVGYPIEIIDGSTEARLTFLGAVGNRPETNLVIDIGGGSTEYALGRDGSVTFATSIPFGAVKFTERFATIRPLPCDAIEDARREVRSLLAAQSELNGTINTCIGVAGTPTALAMIDAKLHRYDAEQLDGYQLSRDRVEELAQWLCSLTLDDLRSIPGLHERRADIVPMGAMILAESMAVLGCTTMNVAVRGLRFGAMLTA
ncbi:MAG: Ppx/GppA family phosphatase [Candidatus Kapabacteria bacterium]|nr:Ppx/GppA family phosphatase [Candidatus Kapabacteria bacterium]